MDKLLLKIIPSVILFIACTCFLFFKQYASLPMSFIYGYLAMSLPWGWGWTGDKLGRRGLFPKDYLKTAKDSMEAFSQTMSTMDHVVHWFLRIFLSVFLGGIFFPITVIKLIIAFNKAKKEKLNDI
jgi:hypothetical protein